MSLRDRFLKSRTSEKRNDITLSRANLAASVAPIVSFEGNGETNAELLAGFKELKELVRIGFATETIKGGLFEDLNEGLDHFISRIEAADEAAPAITFNGGKAFKFRDGSDQIGEASYQMTVIAGVKEQRAELERIAPGLAGPSLMKASERPNADHTAYSNKLVHVKHNIQTMLDGGDVVRQSATTLKFTPK